MSFSHVAFQPLSKKVKRPMAFHLFHSIWTWQALPPIIWPVGLFVRPYVAVINFSFLSARMVPSQSSRQMVSLTLLISSIQGSLVTITFCYVRPSLQMPRPALPVFSDNQPSSAFWHFVSLADPEPSITAVRAVTHI